MKAVALAALTLTLIAAPALASITGVYQDQDKNTIILREAGGKVKGYFEYQDEFHPGRTESGELSGTVKKGRASFSWSDTWQNGGKGSLSLTKDKLKVVTTLTKHGDLQFAYFGGIDTSLRRIKTTLGLNELTALGIKIPSSQGLAALNIPKLISDWKEATYEFSDATLVVADSELIFKKPGMSLQEAIAVGKRIGAKETDWTQKVETEDGIRFEGKLYEDEGAVMVLTGVNIKMRGLVADEVVAFYYAP